MHNLAQILRSNFEELFERHNYLLVQVHATRVLSYVAVDEL